MTVSDTAALAAIGAAARELKLPTVRRNLRGTPWLTMVIAEGPAEVVAPPEVPADVRAAATGDWVSAWICLTAARLLSYADESTVPSRS